MLNRVRRHRTQPEASTRRGLFARPPKHRQRGAVIIEAAIVFPLLITLVMGILEFGMVFSDKMTVTSSTRAGARSAVAYSRQAGYDAQAIDAVTSALTSRTTGTPLELWIYKVDTTNDKGAPIGFSDFSNCSSSCQKYTWNTTTSKWDNSGGGNWLYGSQNACTMPLDQLGVWVKVKHDLFTGLFGDSMTLTDHTVMRLEPQPLSVCG
jgi:Flp pilus assembly protein TadG